MLFEMVGMQFDQARHDIVALHILAGGGRAGTDIDDRAVLKDNRSVQDLVFENQAGIGQYGLWRHGCALVVMGRESAGDAAGTAMRALYVDCVTEYSAYRACRPIRRERSASETLSKTNTTIRIRMTI